MPEAVFFSWQSDTPESVGRNLVLGALEVAVARLSDDASVDEAQRDVRVDIDTRGVPGSPPIVQTIFNKIDQSSIYVADLTFVASRLKGRPSPNPNVLIEYGWALRALGSERVVLLMNDAYGAPTSESLPFNLAHLRHPITYNCPENAGEAERKAAKAALARALEEAIAPILKSKRQTRPQERKAFAPKPFAAGPGRFRQRTDPLGISRPAIGFGSKEIFLKNAHAVWLHVYPQFAQDRTLRISDIKAILTDGVGGYVPPLGGLVSVGDFVRAADGFGSIRSDDQSSSETSAVTFVFNTGEVWGVDTSAVESAVDPVPHIPVVSGAFLAALPAYVQLLTRLGISGPFRWEAGIDGVKNRPIIDGPSLDQAYAFAFKGRCLADLVFENGTFEIGDDPRDSLTPFFLKLFDTCGVDLPKHLNSK